MYLET